MESKSSGVMEENMVVLDKNTKDGAAAAAEKKKAAVEEEEVFHPGFRFHPTDEELVGFYLRRKVEKKPLSIALIRQIDIYKYDPWDLPQMVSNAEEKEWYFFCLRGRKYRNSIRPNRVTGSGFWKATGIDRPIYPSGDGNNRECIGLKKSLVYYRGSAGKGTKTDWMMHEFRLPSNSTDSPSLQEAEIWTICRILKRNITYRKYAPSWKEPLSKQIQAESSSSKTSSFESDIGDEYKCFGANNFQQGDQNPSTNYTQDTNQYLFAGQWNQTTQSPLTPVYPNIASPNSSAFHRQEENWDELGRIVEYMIDPALIYDSTYF